MLSGREDEVATIDQLLAGARVGTGGAVVVRGQPGMGKSAILGHARDVGEDFQTLTARGVEAESDLPFAAIHQLLRPVWRVVEQLEEPEGDILRAAFGSDSTSMQQRFLVYSAMLTLLSDLAGDRPLLCLVDDAQWLDSASADALAFVARRLDCEPIAMLFAVRDGVDLRFDARDLPQLTLPPLPPDVAGALLRRTADVDDVVAARILEHARGSPLALIELPRALSDAQLAGHAPLPDVLPLTVQLEAAYAARATRLPDEVRHLLALLAVDDTEDVAVVSRAARLLGLDPSTLDDAERAGLVVLGGSRVEFTHPLVRSSLLASASSSERRRAHRALADALDGDVEHADRCAWHRANATIDPDDGIVRQLDEAATRAERRGGHVAAARALERAAQLSVDTAARSSRLGRAARNLSVVGRDREAAAIVEAIDDRLLAPGDRATVAFVRASAAIRSTGRPAEAVEGIVAVAHPLAATDPRLAVSLLPLATYAAWQVGDHQTERDIAAIVSDLDVGRLDGTERQLADSILGFAALLDGDDARAAPLLGRTIEWGRHVDDAQQVIWAAWAALRLGDDEALDALLRRAARIARARGELGALAEALGMHAVQLAVISQQYDDASSAASEALQLARDLRSTSLTLLPTGARAICAAVRGDDTAARTLAADLVSADRGPRTPLRTSPAGLALALVDNAHRRWPEAIDSLASITDANDPTRALSAPELVEAAVRAGRPELAADALARLERRVARSGSVALRARLEASRALLATDGSVDDHFRAAAEALRDAGPFDRARVQLLHGEHLRRRGDRVGARPLLHAAVVAFDELGASTWAERARQELRATGATARRRTPDAVTQLTPQELQIARLAAEGLTNKEIAAQLYLSPRTIDSHLRSVFSKLGLTSRRELRGTGLAGPTDRRG